MAARQVLMGAITILVSVVILIFLYRTLWNQPSSADSESEWNQIGTLVYNNPGMRQNTWFLIYEEPGKPALSKELQFDPASACAVDAPAAPCNPKKMKAGVRVRVEGTLVGNDAVLVRTIQLPEDYTIANPTTATSTAKGAVSTSTSPGTHSTGTSTSSTTSSGGTATTSSSTPSGTGTIPVKLYYYKASQDMASSSVQCSKAGLVAVGRTIPSTNTPLQDTLKLLLRGDITAAEKAQGIATEFPLSDVTLLSASNDNGTLTLAFRDPKNRTSGGSCRAGIMWAEIEATAKQFPGVNTVRYVPETLFQP